MNHVIEAQLETLRHWFNQWKSALVAYSGGVDSALVMAIAHERLGDRALACIGTSPSYPDREMRQAIDVLEKLGAPYRLIETQEHVDPEYAANPTNRCYFCKTHLYGRLRQIADEEGWRVVLDGTNHSDLGDDRPGRLAATEQKVRSPLVELGVTKDHIRAMARSLDLEVWDKPAMACLASRVPHGTPITPKLLQQIEMAEDILAGLRFRQFRVRHHGRLARVELPPESLPRAITLREQIVNGLKETGFTHVCLDLAGFRSEPMTGPSQPQPVTWPGGESE